MDLTVREFLQRHKYTILVAIAASILLWVQGVNKSHAENFIKEKGLYEEYVEYQDL
jgi:hypothetical protein